MYNMHVNISSYTQRVSVYSKVTIPPFHAVITSCTVLGVNLTAQNAALETKAQYTCTHVSRVHVYDVCVYQQSHSDGDITFCLLLPNCNKMK